MAYNFISDVQDIGAFDARVPQDAIKNEPMFFNASSEHAYHNGGPITKSFIAAASLHGWSGAVFDSRVHMLMPGWFSVAPTRVADVSRKECRVQPPELLHVRWTPWRLPSMALKRGCTAEETRQGCMAGVPIQEALRCLR